MLKTRAVGGPRAVFTDREQLDVRDAAALGNAVPLAERWVNLASILRVACVDPAAEDEVAWRWRAVHLEMTRTVIDAAVGGGLSQLVLLSSVYASAAAARAGGAPRSSPEALSHGAMNLAIEAAGRQAAAAGIDVACVRLGAVTWPDRPARAPEERAHWLSHEDCAAAFEAILAADVVPGRFTVFTAVSPLAGERTDVANPFGWRARSRRVGWRRRLRAEVVDLKCRVAASPAGPALRALVGRCRSLQARRAAGTDMEER
ncbi:MAG: hypothetical protein NDJ94_06405 [Vicinamibacteria bacterium]|nr:hypothetical protein [Vicinamibacteria bacterium]